MDLDQFSSFWGKSDLDPYQFTLYSNGDLDQISDLDQFTLPITFSYMITLSSIIMHLLIPLKIAGMAGVAGQQFVWPSQLMKMVANAKFLVSKSKYVILS